MPIYLSTYQLVVYTTKCLSILVKAYGFPFFIRGGGYLYKFILNKLYTNIFFNLKNISGFRSLCETRNTYVFERLHIMLMHYDISRFFCFFSPVIIYYFKLHNIYSCSPRRLPCAGENGGWPTKSASCIVKLACAERERWWRVVVAVQRPFPVLAGRSTP